jgi:hypothetical protein
MKKIVMLSAIVFAFVMTANLAFAGFNMPSTMQSNSVKNSQNGVSSMATTGGNSINQNFSCGAATIYTGAADSATLGVAAMNTNVAVNGGAMQGNTVKGSANYVESGAGTGTNGINQAMVMNGGSTVSTGAAKSRTAGISLMNSNVSVGCPCTTTTQCNSCGRR